MTFCNTGIVPYLGYLFWRRTILEELTRNVFMIFVTNSFLTPMLWLFNIKYFLKRFLICLLELQYKAIDNTQDFPYTQRELNEKYELPPMLISFKFSFFAMTSLMTAFYATLLPLGVILTLLGLIFAFYVEKWNIAHIYKRPEMLNDQLPMFYFNYFRCLIILFGLGNYLFISDFFITSTIWRNIYIIVLVGILVFPLSTVFNFKCISLSKSKTKVVEYGIEYLKFSNDYQRQNPITKKEGNVYYLDQLKLSNVINNEEYETYIKEVNNLNLMEMYYKSQNNQRNIEKRNSFIKSPPQLVIDIEMKNNNKENSIIIEEREGNSLYLLQSKKDFQKRSSAINSHNNYLGIQTINLPVRRDNSIEEMKRIERGKDVVLITEDNCTIVINKIGQANEEDSVENIIEKESMRLKHNDQNLDE